MDLQKKLKLALNENRLLILGTQVLFGFQFNGIFEELFVELPYTYRVLETCGLTQSDGSHRFIRDLVCVPARAAVLEKDSAPQLLMEPQELTAIT